MDRMSALDAAFLSIETDSQPMHVGSVMVFEGPAPSYDDLVATIRGRLPLVPRYRQVPRFVPLSLGQPRWEDDQHFYIDYHLRHTAVPSPGGDEQFRNLIGRVMAQRLDRTKPLWEMWLVEGLSGGRWALLGKTHHAMVDGVSGIDLIATMLSATPDVPEPIADDWVPQPRVSDRDLMAQAIAERVASTRTAFASAADLVRDREQLGLTVGATVKGVATSLSLLRPVEHAFNSVLSPHRVFAWADGSLADAKKVRRAFDATINDVVLAAITGGLRDVLLARGVDPADQQIRSMVPVSVRTEDERGAYNNRVSSMFAELPVGLSDPVDRLTSVTAQMRTLKSSGQSVAATVLTDLADVAPAFLLALGGRAVASAPQRNVQIVTTNVPGPQLPLFFLGRRLTAVYPYVPIGIQVPVTVGIFSYDGMLAFGINGDLEAFPDVDVFAHGIQASLRELVDRV